ncbi:MAG: hypothetical protein QOH31_3030 [Verrucomicrobiota bacterium]|jgi:hypothetical protein
MVTSLRSNGPPARRSEPDWRKEGVYLNRYVTDEQRSRRPIFNATLRAASGWLFFRVARSLRINLDMLVAPPASLREALRTGCALKNSQLTCGDLIIICETAH